jgi:hypothetical protein
MARVEKLFRRRFRFGNRLARLPLRHGNAVLGQQLFGLIFVNIHLLKISGLSARKGRTFVRPFDS